MRNTARPSKTPSPSRISAPKAAIVAIGSKKSDLHRRKNPFNDMLLHKPSGGSSSSAAPASNEPDREDGQQHQRHTSVESIRSIADVRTADRIGEMERALALAREEQALLREELEKVRQHSLVYQETIDDCRRQLHEAYSHIRPQPESAVVGSVRMDIDHEVKPRLPTYREKELMEEIHDLRGRLAEMQGQIVSQDMAYRSKLEQQVSVRETDWNELVGRLHHSEKESQERLQQLLNLKHSISALTRMESQITDSEVTERVGQLYHRIREWVVGNYRRTKLDFSSMSKDVLETLGLVTHFPKQLDPTDRLALYQSIVSSHIMCIFREPLCVGLPDTGPLAPLKQVVGLIRTESAEYGAWRRATIRAMNQSTTVRAQLEARRETLIEDLAKQVQHHLFSLTSVTLASAAQASLLNILSSAVDLHQVLLLQKAQYKVKFFRNGEQGRLAYDEAQMENNNDREMENEFDIKSCRLDFCVFPGLEKYGNEAGEHLDVRNVLLKARVCCSGA